MTRTILSICALLILGGLMAAITGCMHPPEGTVFIDFDGDDKVDALAVDANKDGVPDLDADGNPKIVAGSEGYKIAEGADSVVPQVLMWLGGVIGVPVLVGVGAAWKGSRFGRVLMNTVMSVQAARRRLKDEGNSAALAIVDEALSTQAADTVKEIRKIKDKIGLPSVTN